MSPTEQHKRLVRDYFRAFVATDKAWWQAYIAPDFRRHDPGLPFAVVGPAGIQQLADVLLAGIPDMTLPIEDLVAENDKVLARLRVLGTHAGELLGVAATNRKIDIDVMDLFQVRDGQLVEHWALIDNLGLLRQIGAVD